MLRHVPWSLLLICVSLTGCTAGSFAQQQVRMLEKDVAENGGLLATHTQEQTQVLLLLTPPGSHVQLLDVTDTRNVRYSGTLLRADAENVELMNCVCKEAVPAPGNQQQIKTSHVPFQSLKTATLTHLTVIAPPDADFVSSDHAAANDEVAVDSIVFKSGRRLQWGRLPSNSPPVE